MPLLSLESAVLPLDLLIISPLSRTWQPTNPEEEEEEEVVVVEVEEDEEVLVRGPVLGTVLWLEGIEWDA